MRTPATDKHAANTSPNDTRAAGPRSPCRITGRLFQRRETRREIAVVAHRPKGLMPQSSPVDGGRQAPGPTARAPTLLYLSASTTAGAGRGDPSPQQVLELITLVTHDTGCPPALIAREERKCLHGGGLVVVAHFVQDR